MSLPTNHIPVYISLFKPRWGNYIHWSLWLQGEAIFEVSGEPQSFKPEVLTRQSPHDSPMFKKNIFIGDVLKKYVGEFAEIVSKVPVNNEMIHWTCQDWVLEALEALVDEGLLEGDEQEYMDGVQEAKERYYGPQI